MKNLLIILIFSVLPIFIFAQSRLDCGQDQPVYTKTGLTKVLEINNVIYNIHVVRQETKDCISGDSTFIESIICIITYGDNTKQQRIRFDPGIHITWINNPEDVDLIVGGVNGDNDELVYTGLVSIPEKKILLFSNDPLIVRDGG